jgi:hypothetical protein
MTSIASAQQVQENSSNLETQLVISDAIVDDFTGSLVEIYGTHFDNGNYLLVTLGDQRLTVISNDSESIEAELPPNTKAGSYVLIVSTGLNATQFDAFEIAIDEIGPTDEKDDEGDEWETVADEGKEVIRSQTEGVKCNIGNCTDKFFKACDEVFRWIGPCLLVEKNPVQTGIRYLCTCCDK